MNALFLVFATLVSGSPEDGNSSTMPDPCAGALPPAVQAVLPSGTRLPKASELILPHAGCYGVSTGDFNGDGVKDYLLALSTGEESMSIAVALAKGGGYELALLLPHQYGDGEVSITVKPPGTIHQHEKACSVGGRGQLMIPSRREVSKFDTFCIGGVGTVCYAFREGKWHSVMTYCWM